ncbi:glycosyl hydrolase family 43 [Roseateles sp. DAIF2]|uniref:glucosamine inositolphosphorylceramide transferase family protein n=1 Tax=Roseateles sp. DAIF2 TaxID=2714952 RepID=UPI0018A3278C|nr:glycosyl hydrolase family 43 [Roseateles sp. DAIF2]QPF74577.1 glycosyl hydrolase family 43 [Roseateles sp. DAIF2]
MFKRPRTDFWAVGIVPAPIETIDAQRLRALRERITWLPDAGPWRYLADPFALRRGDALHVFVEAFDYRTKHGTIERHELDAATLQWRGARTVLARPFHLSYPMVFEHQGETFMMPESNQAGEVALYRATDASLDRWQRAHVLLGGLPVADASVLEHEGRWWMFFALVGPGGRDRRELHLAHAPALTGPWQFHHRNPVHINLGGARPAGQPFVGADGRVHVPVQDSSAGYGSALRLLRFERLAVDAVECALLPLRLTGDLVSDDHVAGLHTLSGCGPLSLIDVKRIDRSRSKQWLDLKRRLRRLVGRPRALPTI